MQEIGKEITIQKNDLSERLFEFAVKVIRFLSTLSNTPENRIIREQLTKCATSAGANYEESQGGSSRADFTNKIRISLREMRESSFWIRLIKRISDVPDRPELDFLLSESEELKKILGSIVQKCRK